MTATTQETLFAYLDARGIAHETHTHAPVFTVEEAKALRGQLAGGHTKNLFLKDKKGELWLVVCLEDRAVDLKWLRKALGARNLSFGKPELLRDILGVEPGSVTPFAAINDKGARVQIILDAAMMNFEILNFHPLENDKTTQVTPDGLLRFLEATGHTPRLLDFESDTDADIAGTANL